MSRQRHARDSAWQIAKVVVNVFAPLLRDEELVDAHREVVAVLEPRLVELLDRYDRERRRLGEGAPGMHHADDTTARRDTSPVGEPTGPPISDDLSRPGR